MKQLIQKVAWEKARVFADDLYKYKPLQHKHTQALGKQLGERWLWLDDPIKLAAAGESVTILHRTYLRLRATWLELEAGKQSLKG